MSMITTTVTTIRDAAQESVESLELENRGEMMMEWLQEGVYAKRNELTVLGCPSFPRVLSRSYARHP